eukprot:TRINITY_DN4817_c0_g1_i4.p1 TRINITY_DN4817_c0_g1~~TRINITY_DN4817_c0_g1_i4.p1  ORF type:complete len:150 (-),score=22.90 TRINITY_DN4817_c0_g1_i4:314-763(-)
MHRYNRQEENCTYNREAFNKYKYATNFSQESHDIFIYKNGEPQKALKSFFEFFVCSRLPEFVYEHLSCLSSEESILRTEGHFTAAGLLCVRIRVHHEGRSDHLVFVIDLRSLDESKTQFIDSKQHSLVLLKNKIIFIELMIEIENISVS